LSKFTVIATIFKDLPSGASTAGKFLVILGYILDWLLFWIFAGGSIIILVQVLEFGASLLDLFIALCLATTWCPWLASLLLKKSNYKMVFCSKIIATALILTIAIAVSS